MIQAIETQYNGHNFRSRLEARYAVLFDNLNIKWDYEPQGYKTEHGPYLPDFLLYLREPTLVEVKPWPGPDRDPRWEEVSKVTRLIVARGMPHVNAIDKTGTNDSHYEAFSWSTDLDQACWDDMYAFCVCITCGSAGIEHSGRSARICRHGDSDKAYSADHPRVINAYRAALSARFEHGETP